MERDSGAVEDAGNLRHRAGLAESQPFACHFSPVSEGVEPGIVDGLIRLEVEDNHRDFGLLHNRKDCRGKRIGGDIKKDESYIARLKKFGGPLRFVHRIDKACGNDFSASGRKVFLDFFQVALEPLSKSCKLRPVSLKADAEKPDFNMLGI